MNIKNRKQPKKRETNIYSDITEEKLHDALRKMGEKHLKQPYKTQWTPERPTTGYCYVVTEMVYHCLAPRGSKSYVLKTEDINHWFIRQPNGQVIDLTADQFDIPLQYEKGKPQAFLTKNISKRGQILADLLGLNKKK